MSTHYQNPLEYLNSLYRLGKFHRETDEVPAHLDFFIPIILEYINSRNTQKDRIDHFLEILLNNKLNRSTLQTLLRNKYIINIDHGLLE